MTTYRSKQTINAVQYKGEPIDGVTCHGSADERQRNGCDGTRAHLPHVHTASTGGLDVVKPGDWIYPVHGGPFAVKDDASFRVRWEVPEPLPLLRAPEPAPVSKPHIPDLKEVMDSGYDEESAKRVIARETLIANGFSVEDAHLVTAKSESPAEPATPKTLAPTEPTAPADPATQA